MNLPSWSLKKTIPFLALTVLIAVAVAGIHHASDSIKGISRQTALSSYEDSLVALAEDEEGLEPEEEEEELIVDRRIALVHVGRAGGTTITKTFPRLMCRQIPKNLVSTKLLQECFQKHKREDSPLSSQLELELHSSAGKPSEELNDFSTFLFTIRNPLTRVISAYHSLHHDITDKQFALRGHALKDNFYKLCFPTLPKLLSTVHYLTHRELAIRNRGKEVPVEHSDYCQQLALAVLRGKNPLVEKINVHLHRNYHFYYDQTMARYPKKELFAIRTEHEWEDIKALDAATGGKSIFQNEGLIANSNVEGREAPTQEQFRDLCCILWEELETYQNIVNRARNLEHPSKLEAMQDVWSTCGIIGRELTKFKVEDIRTDAIDSLAREKNGDIVVFSWSQWHQGSCTRTLWDHHRFNFASPPPEGILH